MAVNTFIFSDNAASTIASPLSAGSTSVTLAAGTGGKFPSPQAGQQFSLTFNDAATKQVFETVYVTARSGDTMTIVRAQEGTSPVNWSVGDYAFHGPTAGTMAAMIQLGQMTNASIAPVFGPTQVDGNATVTGTETVDAGVISTGYDAGGLNFRATYQNNYGAGLRVDATNASLLSTGQGSPLGPYSSFIPFAWNMETGAVSIDETGAGANFGGQISAPAVANKPAINIGGAAAIDAAMIAAMAPSAQTSNLLNLIVQSVSKFAVDPSGNVSASGKMVSGVGARNAVSGTVVNISDYGFGATNNGYMIFPNLFIVQWGAWRFSTLVETVIFPLTFPNGPLWVGACSEAAPAGVNWGSGLPTLFAADNDQMTASGFTAFGINFYQGGWESTSPTSVGTMAYFAIGH